MESDSESEIPSNGTESEKQKEVNEGKLKKVLKNMAEKEPEGFDLNSALQMGDKIQAKARF